MKRTIEKIAGKSGWFGVPGILSLAVVVALSMFLAAGAALAGDHSGRRAGATLQNDSKVYGVIEKLPQGEVGTWIVNGREIVVTKDTRIREKHGKAKAGAYVEVEGDAIGKAFTAYEIEVKRAQ